MTEAPSELQILVSVDGLSRLFHSFDPSPFRERDLDVDAEKFIVGWAQDAPAAAPLAIVIQLPGDQTRPDSAALIEAAVRNNFDYKVGQETRALRELFREGWSALLVGIPILAVSMIASQLIGIDAAPASTAGVISESLLILGWVANWKPLEIFLYGWWPIVRRRTLYRRLAAARVEVRGI